MRICSIKRKSELNEEMRKERKGRENANGGFCCALLRFRRPGVRVKRRPLRPASVLRYVQGSSSVGKLSPMLYATTMSVAIGSKVISGVIF